MARALRKESKGLEGLELGTKVEPYDFLRGKLIHVAVGSVDHPASPDNIRDIEELFERKLKGIDCRLVVTGDLVCIRGIF